MKGMMDAGMKAVMDDPELRDMIESDPSLEGVLKKIQANPMSAMQYMQDPKVGKFLQKAIAKIMPGMESMLGGLMGGAGGGGASAGGKKKKKGGKKKGGSGGGAPDLADLMGGLDMGAMGDMLG